MMIPDEDKDQTNGTAPGQENQPQENPGQIQRNTLEERLAEIKARQEAEAAGQAQAQEAQPEPQAGEATPGPAPQEVSALPGRDQEPGDEVTQPENLGDGLSILGAVHLERENLEPATGSPEVIQPDLLNNPSDQAGLTPGNEKEAIPTPSAPSLPEEEKAETSLAEQPEPTAPESAPAEGQEKSSGTESTGPAPAASAEPASPTAAPEVVPGATQSDVLTGSTEPADAAPRQQHDSTADHAEEDHDHDLEESSFSAYDALSAEELQARLFQSMKEPGANRKPRHVFELHRRIEQRYNAEKANALDRFVSEGGSAEDFEYSGSRQFQEVEQAMQQFRESRFRDQRQEEEQKVQNLARKRDLLHQLRELVEAVETRSSGERMKAIQAEWKATGPVPQGEAQELWNSYHALLDIYYNNRSIYNELKELDRKRNLDLKVQLCERAEALAGESSINKSLQELRHLHEEWKAIGPVPNEVRDSIWDRFIQASEQVHKRKNEYLAKRNEEEGQNLVKKQALIERIEPLQQFSSDRINEWREKTDEIQKLKEEWDAVGLVPKSEADSINKRFWSAYKAFFQHKNHFFKSLDEQKMNNLRLKTELCEQAEAMKDAPDWNETREKFIQLQKQWKTIGRVPDKHSDKIWDRFRTACNAFFDRKNEEAKQREVELDKQSAEKEAFYTELSERVAAMQEGEGSIDELNTLLQRWEDLDSNRQRVNHKQEDKFYSLLEKYLLTLPNVNKQQLEELKFQLQVSRMRSNPDGNQKIHHKEQHIRREISDLENNIRTLQTNIEFFSRSKNAEKLRQEYEAKIEESNNRIENLKRQLKVLRG